MIVTVAIGNTSTRLVAFSGRRAVIRAAYPSSAARAARLPGLRPGALGIVSVREDYLPAWRRRLKSEYRLDPFILRPATPTGLEFDYPRDELGLDRVCAAVGAWSRWKTDLVALDFGTATTVNVVTAPGVFRGGYILPGITGLALLPGTLCPALPAARPVPARRRLGRGTQSALDLGLGLLLSGGLAAILDACAAAAGTPLKTVITGGAAGTARRFLPGPTAHDPDLVCRGLAAIMRLNRIDKDA